MAKIKDKEKVEDVEQAENNEQMPQEEAEDTSSKKDKKKKRDKSEKNEKSGKGKKILTLILLFILIASIAGYIFLFNGFGVRDTVLRPYLEKVPVVSNYLPPKEEATNLNDLMLENEELKAENELLKQQAQSATDIAENNSSEIERLKLIEEQQTEFVAMKEEFDRNFANMTSENFIAYYDAMYPDVAQEVYAEVVSEKYDKALVDDYIATFQSMAPESISGILIEMMNTDMELVILIMQSLDTQLAGDTLSAMDAGNAAEIARLMSPEGL